MAKQGRQYHIGLKRGDVGEYILLCGDPARVSLAKKFFQKIEREISNREFITCTGLYNNIRISVMSTGIGPDNMEIVVVELANISKNPTLLRVGSCGALLRRINIGDIVITTGAVRLENTTSFFVHEGYPAVANYEVVHALVKSCEHLKVRYHVGITATAPGFYGAQGRYTKKFTPRFSNLLRDLSTQRVINFEMEASSLLTLASLAGFRAGVVCTTFANRPKNTFISPDAKKEAETRCLKVAFKAIEILSREFD